MLSQRAGHVEDNNNCMVADDDDWIPRTPEEDTWEPSRENTLSNLEYGNKEFVKMPKEDPRNALYYEKTKTESQKFEVIIPLETQNVDLLTHLINFYYE